MKINALLQKFESSFIFSKNKSNFLKNVRKGDIVSIIYYDIEKEQIRIQQFTGICSSIKSAGLNTKFSVLNIIEKITVYQQFFLYSKIVSDVIIVRKKVKI